MNVTITLSEDDVQNIVKENFILDKYIEQTKDENQEIHNELLKYSKGARCTFPGWKCIAPCIFGAKNAMIRKI